MAEMRMQLHFDAQPEGDGARVDYRIRFDWPWYLGGAVVGQLVARTLEREITSGLGRMAAALR